MKCPHCKYEDNGDYREDNKEIGGHYAVGTAAREPYKYRKLPDYSEKRSYAQAERKDVYACASCGILFINVNN